MAYNPYAGQQEWEDPYSGQYGGRSGGYGGYQPTTPKELFPWGGGSNSRDILRDITKMAGIGLLLRPGQLDQLDPRIAEMAKAVQIPRAYTRGYGESLLRRGQERLSEGQQARSRDLQGQIASTVGLRSGFGAEMQRQNLFDEARENARFQNELEEEFRRMRVQELLDRLAMVQGIWSGSESIAQQKHPGGSDLSQFGGGIGSMLGMIGGSMPWKEILFPAAGAAAMAI